MTSAHDAPEPSAAPPPSPGGTPPPVANVQRLLAVAGGKGGVGKSTVAVNLALALQQRGYRVGLLDADVHGPNVPRMLGVRRRADAVGWGAILPLALAEARAAQLPALERYGVQVMSLGLLAGEDQALLVDNAALVGLLVRGLLSLVDWGELDLLLLDLPPGTGEPMATLLQTIRLDGVLVVTTPQDVARLDANRALAAFRAAQVPILGRVENMAYLQCPHCHERIEVFHRSQEQRALLDEVPLLAELPLDPVLALAAEMGRPVLVTEPTGFQATAFLELAQRVAAVLELND